MKYDLVVVGTGFASSFFLKRYLEKAPASARVLVLDGGGFLSHQDRLAKARETPYGLTSFITNGAAGELPYKNTNPEKPWIFSPGFGGGSNCWTGCTPRFMPNDFRLKSVYNVGEDWPLSYDELEPYFCAAEEVMTISGPAGTPYPMSIPYPQQPHQLSTVDKLLQKQHGNLYISQPTARSSIAGKRNQCCTSTICHLCPQDAKFTIENGLKHIYDDARVELSPLSKVYQLDTANDHIRSVRYLKGDKEHTVEAAVTALGANAIFNAHILLNSGDTNRHTGHYLSEQVGYYAYAYLDGLDNVGGSSTITANGYMLYDTVDRSRMAACILESHNDFFVRHESGKWRAMAKFKFVFEDIALYENCVQRSDDPYQPLTSYNTHSQYVTKGYDHLKTKMEDIFKSLPIESMALDETPQASEAHIIGTTRMSPDASTGVTDRHMIHHRYRNLFVLGSSNFPTQSPANPTLTIAALSLMSADRNF